MSRGQEDHGQSGPGQVTPHRYLKRDVLQNYFTVTEQVAWKIFSFFTEDTIVKHTNNTSIYTDC